MQNEQPPPDAKPVDKGGRPPHARDEKIANIVRMCKGFGIPQDEIALALGISLGTLKRHYKRELKTGRAQTQVQLVSNLLAMSNKKDAVGLRATIFALTTQFGWSQFAGPQLPPPEDEPPKGKKIRQLEEAQDDGGSSWGEINRLPVTRPLN